MTAGSRNHHRLSGLYATLLVLATTLTLPVTPHPSPDDPGTLERVIRELITSSDTGHGEAIIDPLNGTDDDGEWLIKIQGGMDEAKRVADSTGMRVIRRLFGSDNIYVFEGDFHHVDNATGIRRKRSVSEVGEHLVVLRQVVWAEHQLPVNRAKRDAAAWLTGSLNDVLWPREWQINDHGKVTDQDMKVPEVWVQGYTGHGVVVSILDDGLDYRHPDLFANYDAAASCDLNGNDFDPTPRYDGNNKHGTRCAGEVAMLANNSICGVGVAYNAKIAGVRMLDGRITDRVESEALKYGASRVSIYSSSWGPNDDGKTVEGPGMRAQEAIVEGIKIGRGGKGSIYVWASGNGGKAHDDCSCDGYASSIFTFSVSSADDKGKVPWYSEACPSTIATTYSSGSDANKMIVTTDTQNQCTTQHSGTSASAPLAAGIIALALQANPNLSWRDVQHLTAWTSNPAPLDQNAGWYINGAGFVVSSSFGFGLMNALNMVNTAKTWVTVPQQKICTTSDIDIPDGRFTPGNEFNIFFEMDGCKGQPGEVGYIEQIQLVATIATPYRGYTSIFIVSPSGTETQLLKPRPKDSSNEGFKGWPFTSLHNWGENPAGRWQVIIRDNGPSRNAVNVVKGLKLIAIGTTEPPAHYVQYHNRTYPGVDLQRLLKEKSARALSRSVALQTRYRNIQGTQNPGMVRFPASAASSQPNRVFMNPGTNTRPQNTFYSPSQSPQNFYFTQGGNRQFGKREVDELANVVESLGA